MAVRRSTILLSAAVLPLAISMSPAAAQPVVQPLPPPAAGELSEALRRLARSPSDFDALIAAGRASLALGDLEAAVGFFARADAVRPGDPRIKAGLATAYLKSDRPIEALEMFEQAEAAGAPPAMLAADRGLAFDLVGDNASAQAQYRLALSQGPNPEVTRRLGLSQAIAGDRRGFEASLMPQLQRRDFAAYRVRAFGLAILGEEQEAVSIAEAVMPRDLANQITPYLRYMPRLTRAQQAAAANLGSFPRAAQIGRDDPRFAQYSGPSRARPGQTGDARLAPAGAPLGPRTAAAQPSRADRRQAAAAQRQREREEQDRAKQAARQAAQASRTPTPAVTQPPVVIARADPPAANPASLPSQARSPVVTYPAAAPPPPPPPAAPSIVLPAPPPPPPPAAPAIELPPAPVVVAQLAPDAAAGSQPSTAGPAIVLPAPSTAAPEPADLADAFAEFAEVEPAQVAAAGAVDITAIKPRREVAEPPKPVAKAPPPPPPPPPPPKPKAPSRVWVQVATGKDLGALAFDWRRFGKKAPELLAKRQAYTAKWGESRRLLTGPFDSPRAATKFVSDLKEAGIDSFTFTSEAGEEVTALK